tara:strand:- start:519 stop:2108 length:1590 start_codon:yes stop_codon:yes gene_type:complete
MQEREIKNINLEFKEDGEGKVSAVFSVFNNLDSDGDVVVPGAIKSRAKSGMVPMVWAHKWDMPIGKGIITEDGDKATFQGEFFMDTDSGQEAYKLVKNMGDLQQWSFGYRVNDSEYGKMKKDNSDDEQDVRYLKDLTVFEVSPVLVGANQDTYTMAIKSNKELLEEMVKDGTDKNEDIYEDNFSEEKVALDKDVFDNPGEAMERSKELSCAVGVHTHKMDDGQTVFMPCKTHEEYHEATGNTNKPKGHTPQHTVMQALGTIAEDMKDILKNLPKDEDADLPSWWVDKVKDLAKDINDIRDQLLDPQPEKDLQTIYEDPAKALAEATELGKVVNIVEIDGKSYYKVDSEEEDVEEDIKQSFSQQVTDVLAAFNDLMARATAIAMLRAKDGRRLGMKATDALRSVQEDLTDAWAEVDEFITNFGADEQANLEEVVEEPTEEPVEESEAEVAEAELVEEPAEEVEVIEPEETEEEEENQEEVEAEPAEVPVGESEEEVAEAEVEEIDDESEELWAEGQAIIADSLEADLIEE